MLCGFSTSTKNDWKVVISICSLIPIPSSSDTHSTFVIQPVKVWGKWRFNWTVLLKRSRLLVKLCKWKFSNRTLLVSVPTTKFREKMISSKQLGPRYDRNIPSVTALKIFSVKFNSKLVNIDEYKPCVCSFISGPGSEKLFTMECKSEDKLTRIAWFRNYVEISNNSYSKTLEGFHLKFKFLFYLTGTYIESVISIKIFWERKYMAFSSIQFYQRIF